MELRHLRLTRFVSAAGAVAAIGLLLSPDPAQAQKGGGGTTPPPNPEIVFTDSGIKVMNADGTNARTVVSVGRREWVQDPCWSPYGTALAFVGSFTTTGAGLYTVNLDGSGRRRIASLPWIMSPDWSPQATPDGRFKIAFVADGPAGNHGSLSDLYVVNPDGSGLTNLTNSPNIDEYACTWMRGSSRIVVPSADLAAGTATDDLCELTLGLDTSGNVTVTGASVLWTGASGYRMDWMRSANTFNGLALSYQYLLTSGPRKIYIVDFDQTPVAPAVLRDGTGVDDRSPSFSPDDSKVAFTRSGTAGGIFTINRNGTGEIRIASKGSYPCWKRPLPSGP